MTEIKANLLLRQLRRDAGLSVRIAARQMGISKGTLQRAERGIGEPHPGTMKLIADFYSGGLARDLVPSDIWPIAAREEAVAHA